MFSRRTRRSKRGTVNNSVLPIREKEEEIKELIRTSQVVVVAGETGSGKTTQLPRFCRELGLEENGKIAVTQPRRIAATSTAARVAEEVGGTPGNEVGYRIRFAAKESDRTSILFMTDGILLTEIGRDRTLSDYSVIIVDEAHERSLNIDFLLGYLRTLLSKRRDLKVIISSATIDTELFSRAFNDAPIVNVSGRMFPVEVIYDPIEENGYDYIDQALLAVDKLDGTGEKGDILIFMPTERDIRELCTKLSARVTGSTEVLPLFARLSRKDQNRIFHPGGKRRIIVSTNIAETSVTVPGIRFVIDAGYARINRYSPTLRTNRLPVEMISKAEADQRKGRCGRVSEGICIRLYSEEDYQNLQDFRDAEIRRSNLAGVILSLLHFRLGQISDFPFIERPDERAIRDAFSQLEELGALSPRKKLTAVGKRMCRLPLEPHISRIMIEAEKENIVEELSVICAGLSIVDPRERPQEEADTADKKHAKYINVHSDFLTLLRMWEIYHERFENLRSSNKMRRYCRENFLNYRRMREWVDVHRQIRRVFQKDKKGPARQYSGKKGFADAVHRAVLTGLVTSVAHWEPEEKVYKATRNRSLWIFPGSALMQREKQPEWIMAHEIVQTSRVFARTVAPLNPRWIVQLFPHLIKAVHSPPYYDEEKETVLCEEKLLFGGLTVSEGRKRFYGKIDPAAATRIFVQEALVENRVARQLDAVKANNALYKKLQEDQSKIRRRGFVAEPEQIGAVYEERLPGIASFRDLLGTVRREGSDDFLRLTRDDLIIDDLPEKTTEYPREFTLGTSSFPLSYAFNPGRENDGVTVTVPLKEAPFLQEESLGWIILPLRQEKITALLRQLPRSVRRQLIPLPETAAKLAQKMRPRGKSFTQTLAEELTRRGVSCSARDFSEEELPEHLRMRVAVQEKGKTLMTTRSTEELRNISHNRADLAPGNIEKEIRRWEHGSVKTWNFGDLPPQIELSRTNDGLPLYAFPALQDRDETIALTCLSRHDEAESVHRNGVAALLKKDLQKSLKILRKDITVPPEYALDAAPLGGTKILEKRYGQIVREYTLRPPANPPRKAADYRKLLKTRQKSMDSAGREAPQKIGTLLKQLRKNRELIEKLNKKYAHTFRSNLADELRAELSVYMDQFMEGFFPLPLLEQFPRIMQAFYHRIEKAYTATGKYRRQEEVLLGFQERLADLIADFDRFNIFQQADLLNLMVLVEELGVQLFAHPVMKPQQPVSPEKLEKLFKKVGEA
ncbi:MAG: ATP-dependent RNA helicase HrpA [Fibrobacterota bacterium]